MWYDFQVRPDGSPLPNGAPWAPRWVVRMVGIDFFADVVGATISPSQAGDCKLVSQLPALRHLVVRLQRQDWPVMQHFTNIRSLHVPISDGLRDDDFRYLRPLAALESVRLGIYDNSIVTDGALEHLKTLKHLRYLELDRLFNLTPTGIQELSDALPQCKIKYRLCSDPPYHVLPWVTVGINE